MIDLRDLITNPTNVSEITKILAKYQLMQSIGNVAEKKLTGEAEKEDLEQQMLKLNIEGKRRELGIPNEEVDEHPRRTRGIKVAGELGAGRQLRALDMANQKSMLKPTFKTATIGEELTENLHPVFKTAYAVDEPATLAKVLRLTPEELSHGHSATSLYSSIKRFFPHG